jgi:hypothetical protein
MRKRIKKDGPVDLRKLAALLPLFAAGCAQPEKAPAPAPFIVEVDPDAPRPRASVCRVQPSYGNLMTGVTTNMTVSADGGWCGVRSGRFLDSALATQIPHESLTVVEAPEHGEIVIHKLKTVSAYYYKATPKYSGSDTARLRTQPRFGSLILKISVSP